MFKQCLHVSVRLWGPPIEMKKICSDYVYAKSPSNIFRNPSEVKVSEPLDNFRKFHPFFSTAKILYLQILPNYTFFVHYPHETTTQLILST